MPRSPDSASEDPRALRSRRQLRAALISMLSREDLTQIGVAELCREAGVHRTTFYGHFDSVGDLAADVFASIIDEASAVVPPVGASLSEVSEAYYRATVAVFSAVVRERDAIRTLLESSASLGFRQRLRAHFVRRAADAIEVLRDSGVAVPPNADAASAFIAGGTVGMIEHWARTDGHDAEAYASHMVANMPTWWP